MAPHASSSGVISNGWGCRVQHGAYPPECPDVCTGNMHQGLKRAAPGSRAPTLPAADHSQGVRQEQEETCAARLTTVVVGTLSTANGYQSPVTTAWNQECSGWD